MNLIHILWLNIVSFCVGDKYQLCRSVLDPDLCFAKSDPPSTFPHTNMWKSWTQQAQDMFRGREEEKQIAEQQNNKICIQSVFTGSPDTVLSVLLIEAV